MPNDPLIDSPGENRAVNRPDEPAAQEPAAVEPEPAAEPAVPVALPPTGMWGALQWVAQQATWVNTPFQLAAFVFGVAAVAGGAIEPEFVPGAVAVGALSALVLVCTLVLRSKGLTNIKDEKLRVGFMASVVLTAAALVMLALVAALLTIGTQVSTEWRLHERVEGGMARVDFQTPTAVEAACLHLFYLPASDHLNDSGADCRFETDQVRALEDVRPAGCLSAEAIEEPSGEGYSLELLASATGPCRGTIALGVECEGSTCAPQKDMYCDN